MNKRGRPPKYSYLLSLLEKNTLYTPASIAHYARDIEYITHHNPALEMQRIRIAMGRLSNRRKFPDEGDGMVTLKGQSPCPAWFGWRWQNERNG